MKADDDDDDDDDHDLPSLLVVKRVLDPAAMPLGAIKAVESCDSTPKRTAHSNRAELRRLISIAESQSNQCQRTLAFNTGVSQPPNLKRKE